MVMIVVVVLERSAEWSGGYIRVGALIVQSLQATYPAGLNPPMAERVDSLDDLGLI